MVFALSSPLSRMDKAPDFARAVASPSGRSDGRRFAASASSKYRLYVYIYIYIYIYIGSSLR